MQYKCIKIHKIFMLKKYKIRKTETPCKRSPKGV